jgi:hypothetical protein
MFGPEVPALARYEDQSAPSVATFTALADSIRRCRRTGAVMV